MHVFNHYLLDPRGFRELAWAILNSTWEFAVLWIVLLLTLRSLRRHTPQVRYLTGCATLASMLAAVVITYWTAKGRFDDPGPLVIEQSPTAVQASWAKAMSAITAVMPRIVWAWLGSV